MAFVLGPNGRTWKRLITYVSPSASFRIEDLPPPCAG
jgi:hypothetical protein